ncbi:MULTISPECIES: methylated-DNA--[protein]-cysteine S-methyltransferase [Paracoccus]|uniref:methylated-DNA--[protein]-cysteine S-methyltransferase n=1 Tax=Paracoccus versutus TaxID=34007 RepID=A0A3D9XH79_PARVE|nr:MULTISPECIES: methylated-DNA--[protein]-cysteine S-methyltransferase [Paracoccus]REF69784.1 methylated-DNA-[protein]-cysteine S-methyltransferase [Paracoccus versutus]WGR57854.1 methylated-DNA--[protein]-cysteine S-methyltransferase [Paracoccus versutus]
MSAALEDAQDFRLALPALLGQAPAPDARLLAGWIDTPLGGMVALADDAHLHLLEFADPARLGAGLRRAARRAKAGIGCGRTAVTDCAQAQLSAYFSGRCAGFDLPLALSGTPFQNRVWQDLQQIPAGRTISYAELARRIGRPTAIRAVARANGANPFAVVIPCHRVIGSDGALTGYGGGLWRKQALIAHESTHFAA